MADSRSELDAESFVRLLAEHERSIETYVHSLMRSAADAEDVLQESKLVLWKQFERYEPGTNFLAWARKIALNLILNHRRKEQRRQTSPVDQEFIEAVAAEIDRKSDRFAQRSEFLRQCLQELPRAHKQTITWRYYEDCGIEEIAAKTKRSESATYRLLSRIRQVLNDCIHRKLSAPA
ncbi:MAG: sigma-70 family RNA polymerase sigma factor [Limisphaerales bacterium]